jgi:SAM-dependent methyltransferase
VSALPNYTRESQSIPRRLLREGKPHLIPLYALLRTSDLAREGIENSGSFRFADHIYQGRARGRYGIGWVLDGILLRLRAARSMRNRYRHSRDTIVAEADRAKSAEFRVLSVPCGIARELSEAATILQAEMPSKYQRTRFFALDLDNEPLTLSRELVRKHPHFSFIAGNALDSSVYPKDLDVIVSTGLGDFLDDVSLVRFYGICHQALRPGGVLVTSAQQPQPLADFLMRELAELRATYRDPRQLEAALRSAGFTDVTVRPDAVGLQALAVARKGGDAA